MKALAILLAVILLLAGCTVQEQPPQETESQAWVAPESLYKPEDFVLVGDFLQCTAGNAVVGIDVSSHQGQIDWNLVAASGVKFAFVRLGYRGYGDGSLNEDTYAKANLAGAKAAGLKVGAYFFSQAVNNTEALAEATFALGILDGFALDLPLVYDWEYINEDARTGKVNRATLTNATVVFCEAVKMCGYRPMVYFNTNQAIFRLKLETLENYPWWLAKYNMDSNFLCKVDLWQYTDQGSVPGITGNVDIDLMFTDYGLGKEIFGG